MNWKLCIDTPAQRAFNFCHGYMNKGWGFGCGYGDTDGDGNNDRKCCSSRDGFGDGFADDYTYS